jgi:hypothetical protein
VKKKKKKGKARKRAGQDTKGQLESWRERRYHSKETGNPGSQNRGSMMSVNARTNQESGGGPSDLAIPDKILHA